jgi:hypothetical protein
VNSLAAATHKDAQIERGDSTVSAIIIKAAMDSRDSSATLTSVKPCELTLKQAQGMKAT